MTEPMEIEFDRMTVQGMAEGTLPGSVDRAAVVWGVLPGERARVLPIRRQKGVLFCRLQEIVSPSPDRIAPREAHYLCCSPWQVMSYAAQVRSKRAILAEFFPRAGLGRFVETGTVWGYRNKLEFSFTEEGDRLLLAFHERSSPVRKTPLPDGCALGSVAMNAAACEVVERLTERGIREKALKSLVVRGSRTSGEVLSALYVTDENFPACEIPLECSAGFAVFFSDPLSPASVATKKLHGRGAERLIERVAGLELAYPFDGFFQNHAEAFACAIEEIRRHTPACNRLVELYSGVGTIGLRLADRAREILAVESNEAAVELARQNSLRAGVTNYRAHAARAEVCAEDLLAEGDVVVADPPRSGMHPKVIAALARARPQRILYLSCNPATQARDIALLGAAYQPVELVGFDFYPQTPHIESLVVLDRATSGDSKLVDERTETDDMATDAQTSSCPPATP